MNVQILSGKTRVCGIFGAPVEHSISPPMQNAAFAAAGLDYCYVPFHVAPENLASAVAGIRALNLCGVNVTIPHKVTVMPYLDKIDTLARRIGAVNTIVNDAGVLTGYNTDAAGFLRALTERGIDPDGKRVVVVGAGGAARALAFILAEHKARITILNRKVELDWAEELADRLTKTMAVKVKASPLDNDNLKHALDMADILINATSVGMNPDFNNSPVPVEMLRSSLAVFDAVYTPMDTRLLREAKQTGAVTISGIEMLIWQGALAFELWTGAQAPLAVMRDTAMRLLNEK